MLDHVVLLSHVWDDTLRTFLTPFSQSETHLVSFLAMGFTLLSAAVGNKTFTHVHALWDSTFEINQLDYTFMKMTNTGKLGIDTSQNTGT